MLFERRAIAFDLGAHSIKVVQVAVAGARASLARSLVLPRSQAAVERVDPSDPVALADWLREELAAAGWKARSGVLAIDGAESIIRYTHMPSMAEARLKTVMQYEVESVADRMGEALASDYAALPVRRESDGEQTIIIGLAKEASLARRLEGLEAAGIRISAALPAPLALYTAWDLYAAKEDPDSPHDDLVLAVDIGARSLNVALILNSRFLFARSSNFGGHDFTEALAAARGIPLEEAEALKVSAGGLDDLIIGVDKRTVQPLRGAAGQLLGMLQSSLRFSAGQTGVSLPPLTRLWLTGGGARLRGLPEYLGAALGDKRVDVFDAASSRSGPDAGGGATAGGDSVSLGVPIGLAVLGLRMDAGDESVVALNVLPAKYKARRVFRERTIFLYASAALIVLLLGAQLFRHIVVRVDAASIASKLQSAKRALELRQEEKSRAVARSSQTQARINRLLHEAEVNAFQAFVLAFLGEVLRPEIQLQLVHLDAAPRGEAGGFDYSLIIEGRVNDEKRKGLDWILELQDLLAKEERIQDVQVLQSRREGPWYVFRLSVRPNAMRI
ncbi:MAG: pilus assembly protein PilM [Planctomycetes bacterium]|nr:pilus assembly protein PilM [Planctomycetota bacterium]